MADLKDRLHKKDTSQTGRIGEDIACQFLRSKGFKIVDRNYRKKWGEIDIIARAPDLMLIFIEVKTLSMERGSIFLPEYNLTTQKLNKVKRICEFFAAKYAHFINEELGWRIDLIAIEIFEEGDSFSVRHYENI